MAIGAYRVMAYKDEYEVARLYAASEFKASLQAQFSKTDKVSVWLAPPMLSRLDPATGRPKKRKFGPWIFKAMRVLAALRGLRNTAFDPFGYTQERRSERALAAEFLADMERLSEDLSQGNHQRAVELAMLVQEVRGFGPVKEAAMSAYWDRRAALREAPLIDSAAPSVSMAQAA